MEDLEIALVAFLISIGSCTCLVTFAKCFEWNFCPQREKPKGFPVSENDPITGSLYTRKPRDSVFNPSIYQSLPRDNSTYSPPLYTDP